MISGKKLIKLYETEVNANQGNLDTYTQKVRGLFGIKKDELGREKFVADEQAMHPNEFSLQEMADGMLGRDYDDKLRDWTKNPQRMNVNEAEGGVIMPSHFMNINAYTAAVHGLLDALVMEAYSTPAFIANDWMTTYPTRVNGGKMIGVKLTDDAIDQKPLASGYPYPTVGLHEDFVNIPENERRGLTIQLNLETILYDRTDQVRSAATTAGQVIAYNKERRCAAMFLGLTNPYARLDVRNATYQPVAGAIPHNFVNEEAITLTDFRDIDQIVRMLGRNRCPASTMPISIDLNTAQLFVFPAGVMAARHIARTTEIISVNTPNMAISRSPNPLEVPFSVASSFNWYALMVDLGYNPDDFNSMWLFGNPKKAFGWRELVPFGIEDAVLSSEDLRRDIVMIKVAREIGVPFVKEPRYMARGAEDAEWLAELPGVGGAEASPAPQV